MVCEDDDECNNGKCIISPAPPAPITSQTKSKCQCQDNWKGLRCDQDEAVTKLIIEKTKETIARLKALDNLGAGSAKVDKQVKLAIVNSISENSDTLDADTLKDVIATASEVELNFEEVEDDEMEGQMTNILKTTDNLGKSLDFGKDNIDKEAYAAQKKQLEAMMRKNIDNLAIQMSKKKKAKIESVTAERTLVLQKFDFDSIVPTSLEIQDDSSDGEDSSQKGKVSCKYNAKDLFGGQDPADGEDVFLESIVNKFNPHELEEDALNPLNRLRALDSQGRMLSTGSAATKRGDLASKVMQMKVNKVSSTGKISVQKVKDLGNKPVEIKLPFTRNDLNATAVCRFWDDSKAKPQWSTEGVTTVGPILENGVWYITCKTTHFTDFGGFEIPAETPEAPACTPGTTGCPSTSSPFNGDNQFTQGFIHLGVTLLVLIAALMAAKSSYSSELAAIQSSGPETNLPTTSKKTLGL